MIMAAPIISSNTATPMMRGARFAVCWRFRYESITSWADSFSLIFIFKPFYLKIGIGIVEQLVVILPYFWRVGESHNRTVVWRSFSIQYQCIHCGANPPWTRLVVKPLCMPMSQISGASFKVVWLKRTNASWLPSRLQAKSKWLKFGLSVY
jgi:hypothetical protein